jgi:cytochrome c biogenesis protein CcdA/thiol-disulfide isomerase/thioredoxin
MILLLLVAFAAGFGAALSPCVLPVLPALLSTTATGGRRRPVGVVLGLAITFTLSIAVLASAVKGVGLGSSALRDISIAIVFGFGVVLLVPGLATRLEAPLAGLSRMGPKSKGEGFWSGILVGGALGFVYTPCTGPILGAVISISASTHTTLRTLLIAIAYAAGTAVVLLGLALGGRRLLDRARASFGGPTIQRVLGGVLVATALIMVANLDIDLEQAIFKHAPDVNIASALETSGGVKNRIAHDLHGRSRFQKAQARADRAPTTKTASLPVLGPAPDFTGNQKWFNTAGNRPLTLKGLRGRVVLVDFWTYTCINCIRTLPYIEAWDRAYRSKGLTIVGVHSPEFTFEQNAGNVKHAIATDGIKYPVVQDNKLATWDAWGNQYWPADYLIDAQGRVRAYHFGEGDYATLEHQIRQLLAARGETQLGAGANPHHVVNPTKLASPETYLGEPGRSQNFPIQVDGRHDYGPPPTSALEDNEFRYSGVWTIANHGATAGQGARLDAKVFGKNTYVVLGTPDGKPRKVEVLLDGKPITTADSGDDVHHGVLTVSRQRLYSLISLAGGAGHVLSLIAAPGVQGYSFTFG